MIDSEAQLFRAEALDAAAGRGSLGSVRLGKNPSYTVLSMCATVILLSVGIYAGVGGVMRKEKLPGLLEPLGGTVSITASVSGLVLEQVRVEGDFVSEGEPIAVLGLERNGAGGPTGALLSSLLDEKLSALDAEARLRRQQSTQRLADLEARIERMENERLHSDAEVRLAEQRVALSTARMKRSEGLAAVGFMSAIGIEDSRFELLEAGAKLETGIRSAIGIAREVKSLRGQLGAERTQAEADLSTLARARLGVEQERAENELRKTVIVTAPKTGTLSVLNISTGSGVGAGQQLGVLIPGDGQAREGVVAPVLQARLYARSRAIGFIEPGKEVWLKYAAYPYEKFGSARGVVSRVTATPIGATELPPAQARALIKSSESDEPLYRVDVALSSQTILAYGKKMALKPGMQVEADVVLEERKIWEWLLEPLLAMGTSKLRPPDSNQSRPPV